MLIHSLSLKLSMGSEDMNMNDFHNNKILHVTNVTLRVKDITKMLDFYLNILKMKQINKVDNVYSLGTESNRVLVNLVLDENAEVGKRKTGLYHFALLLPTRHDLGVFLNYILKSGYPLSGASDHAVSEALYLNDPEGNGIEIYRDRPFLEWKFNEAGVEMTTIAIDHQTLLKEKGVYSQIPEGTIMGHLHLHVNNIKKAHDFFVDILGFNKMLDYGPTASFISDANYHHHIAYNTWLGTTSPNIKYNQTGLIAYEVNLPLNKVDELIERLNKNNIPYVRTNDEIQLKDTNEVDMHLVLR